MTQPGRPAQKMPKTIGRYEVIDIIGLGAMGAVYRAFDPLIKRTLAIKTLRLDIARDSPEYQTFLKRFYHEARISGTLSHPNIVTLFDIGEDQTGLPFLVMEFVEGQTIEAMIGQGYKFQPERVVGIISQIAAALDYAHGRGVIHRDIKPSNLILFETDRVKVTDFGIAKLVGSEMTQAGQLLGTPSYMSPEQAMGEPLDGRSDLFSLGVCAFEMLSLEQPFPGKNVTSILYKLVHTDPIEPATLEMRGLVPEKWHQVFGKVLAKKPDDRYQTAADFVRDLEYCLGSWFGGAIPDLGDDDEGPLVVEDAVMDTEATTELAGSRRPAAARPPAEPAGAPPAELPESEEGTAILPGSPLPEEASEEGTAILPGSPLAEPDLEATTAGVEPAAAPPPSLPAPSAEPDVDAFPLTLPAPIPDEPDADDLPPTVAQRGPTAAEIEAAGPGASSRPGSGHAKDDSVPPTLPTPMPAYEVDEAATGTIAQELSEDDDFGLDTVAMPDGLPEPLEVDGDLAPTVQTSQAPPAAPADKTVLMDSDALSAARGRSAPPEAAAEKTILMEPPSPRRRPAPTAPEAARGPRGGPPLVLIVGALVVLAVVVAGGAFLLRRPTVSPAAAPPTTQESEAPAEHPGALRVETRPAGAELSLNGEPRGLTPLEIANLADGLYEVSVKLDGYETRQETVAITQGSPRAELRLALKAVVAGKPTPERSQPPAGSADVRSEPSGATVTIAGQEVGTTPLERFRLPPGRHAVKLSLAGHSDWSGQVVVEEGKRARLDVRLEPTAPPPPAATPAVVDVERSYLNLKSQVDELARKVSGSSPRYPADAPRLKSGEAVSVSVSFVVSRDGEVTELEVVESGGEALDRAVLEAVRSWRYSPAAKRGVRVKVKVTIKQTFKAG